MAKTAISSKYSFDNWLLDSGSSAHMTPYRDALEDITRCNIIVTLADGPEIRCNEIGICKLNIKDDEDK